VQAISAGVQAGRQDDGLPQSSLRSGEEEVVEEPCPDGDLLAHRLAVHERVVVDEGVAVDDLDERIDADGTNQRFGERVVQKRIRAL
jgi:hypothetical protein